MIAKILVIIRLLAMTAASILSKIENKIPQLTKDDGYIDDWTQDEIERKVASLEYYARLLDFTDISQPLINFGEYKSKILQSIQRVVTICSLGEPEYESKQDLKALLRKTREIVKGMRIVCELNVLENDQDVPAYIEEELFEDFIDPETGAVYPEQDADLARVLYNLFHHRKSQINSATGPKEMHEELDVVAEMLASLHLQCEHDLVINLGENRQAFTNAHRARLLEAQRIQESLNYYFDPTNQASTEAIAKAAHDFYEAHRATLQQRTQVNIHINDLNAKDLIIAASEALRSVYLCKEKLHDYEEKLHWADATVSITRKPSPGNQGNLLIRNFDGYGYKSEDAKSKKDDVLDVFEKIIAYSGKMRFEHVLARYGHQPNLITLDLLKLPPTEAGETLLARLKQVIFLIFCAEIFRYFPFEGLDYPSLPSSKRVPFAMALALGLELLASGDIELEDLFEKDAALGPATGTQIMHSTDKLLKKWTALLDTYHEVEADFDIPTGDFLKAYPNGYVIREKQGYIEQLAQTFGRNLKKESRLK